MMRNPDNLFLPFRTYRVNALCVIVIDVFGEHHNLYRGELVPQNARADQMEILLASGDIVEVDD